MQIKPVKESCCNSCIRFVCKLNKITHLHLADAFIQSDLLNRIGYIYVYIYSVYTFFCMCVPWELNPQPFAVVTQCSTTEPQGHYVMEHYGIMIYIVNKNNANKMHVNKIK